MNKYLRQVIENYLELGSDKFVVFIVISEVIIFGVVINVMIYQVYVVVVDWLI